MISIRARKNSKKMVRKILTNRQTNMYKAKLSTKFNGVKFSNLKLLDWGMFGYGGTVGSNFQD